MVLDGSKDAHYVPENKRTECRFTEIQGVRKINGKVEIQKVVFQKAILKPRVGNISRVRLIRKKINHKYFNIASFGAFSSNLFARPYQKQPKIRVTKSRRVGHRDKYVHFFCRIRINV